MIVGNSQWEYLLMRAMIYVFSYLGMGCIIYFFVVWAIGGIPAISHPFSIFVEAVGALEILFYLLFFLPYRSYLQRPALLPPPLTRNERRALFVKSAQNIPDFELFARKWLLNAHLDDLRRDNLKDWLLWALFEREGPPGDDDAELEEYIEVAEDLLGYPIKPGRSEANAIRLSFDPVPMMHRSLFFYGFVSFAENITAIAMMALGFSFYAPSYKNFVKEFPFRPFTLLSPKRSAAPDLSYFHRPHKSKTHRPLVIMHGIGVGLLPYLPLLWMLPRDIGITMVEILPISSRICPQHPLMDKLMESITQIVVQQDLSSFVYVGHSYGTMLTAPFLKTAYLAARMHSIVLLDPVALLLHLPDVAYNFTRRKPVKANEWQLYFVQTDAGIASTLGRRFCWRESVLFREHFEGRKTTVIVGSKDNLVNPPAIASYVYSGNVQWTYRDVEVWERTMKGFTGENELDLVWLKDCDHGQSFLSRETLPHLVRIMTTHCRLDKGDMEGTMPPVEQPYYQPAEGQRF